VTPFVPLSPLDCQVFAIDTIGAIEMAPLVTNGEEVNHWRHWLHRNLRLWIADATIFCRHFDADGDNFNSVRPFTTNVC
jgi:hypothetical protein